MHTWNGSFSYSGDPSHHDDYPDDHLDFGSWTDCDYESVIYFLNVTYGRD